MGGRKSSFFFFFFPDLKEMGNTKSKLEWDSWNRRPEVENSKNLAASLSNQPLESNHLKSY